MSKNSSKKPPGILGATLWRADFEKLAGELTPWRADELHKLEAEKGSGLVLGFVKGLRLSAGLIYALRKKISGRRVEVHWGHLLNPTKNSCSPECDIIIHKEGVYEEWNGHEDRVMDFKFIECEQVIGVVSCKSYAKTIDVDYPKKLSPYVRTVFLFAECCPPALYATLRQKAKKAGYYDFWCLYTYDETTGTTSNQYEQWDQFVATVLGIVKKDG